MFCSLLFYVLFRITCINAQIIQNALNESVEYPGIGKFNSYDFYDKLYRPVFLLPQSPDRIGVKFLLFTPTDPIKETYLYNDNHASIQNSDFDPKLDTKFIVHGFIDDLVVGEWMRQIKDNYLKRGNYNIIIIDWSLGNLPPYGQATVNTRVVGALTANLIKDLHAVHNIPYESVHIIGHSLGSHVAGYAGERLDKLGRITGLDPAGPLFRHTEPACRLDPTDADFVDSIHTNAYNFGMNQEVSHIDVYPNGGDHQPECGPDQIHKLHTESVIEGVKQIASCNHQRAIDYYISSLTQNNIPIAYRCKDYETFRKGLCAECGDNFSQCAKFGPGIEEWKKFRVTNKFVRMYLKTSGEKPFFLNQYQIKVKLTHIENRINETGTVMVSLNGDLNSEYVVLSDGHEILSLGSTLTYLADFKKDIGVLKSVTFKWHHSLPLLSAQTYLESISVTPLFINDKNQRIQQAILFCSSDPKVPVKHDTEVELTTEVERHDKYSE